jgi:hypothetical protein
MYTRISSRETIGIKGVLSGYSIAKMRYIAAGSTEAWFGGVTERPNVPVLKIPKCKPPNPAKKFATPLKDWRERAFRITVLYRRLPSFTVGSRILFPPNIPPVP